MLLVETFVLGDIQTNCYLITDKATGEMAVIDPGFACNELLSAITASHENKLKFILLTHGHYDHIGFVMQINALTNAKIVIGEDDAEFLHNPKLNLSQFSLPQILPSVNADITLVDNDIITLGETEIKFIKTPGHTKGSGCYIADHNFFTGDTVFKCSMGRTDLPTGNVDSMIKSLNRISEMQGEYKIFPGHGDSSSLSFELKFNPYLGEAKNEDIC